MGKGQSQGDGRSGGEFSGDHREHYREKAVVFRGQQCIDEALWDLLELQRLSLLLAELPDERTITTEYTHRGSQRDVAECTFLWKFWAEIKVKPSQPPDGRAGNQGAVSHHFSGFWHPWTLRRIVSAVGSIRCIPLVGDPSA